jgi:sulfur transfer complex TusBCD TusB component (DsrH family)
VYNKIKILLTTESFIKNMAKDNYKKSLNNLLFLLKEKVDALDFSPAISKQIISLSPEQLIDSGVERMFFKQIFNEIIISSFKLTNQEIFDRGATDIFNEYNKLNLYLADDFYKKYSQIIDRKKTEKETVFKKLTYDKKLKILEFKNKKISFTGKNKQHELLSILFSNPQLEQNYSDIEYEKDNELDYSELTRIDKEKLKKRYNGRASSINSNIAIKVQIKDMLVADMTTVKINPKYIE